MRRILVLAVDGGAGLQPLSPCRATRRRHLVSVRAEPEPDVDELKRQAEALRAEVETLQAEAQAAREEELRRNPPPPPKPVRERPKPVKRKTEEEEGFSLPSLISLEMAMSQKRRSNRSLTTRSSSRRKRWRACRYSCSR